MKHENLCEGGLWKMFSTEIFFVTIFKARLDIDYVSVIIISAVLLFLVQIGSMDVHLFGTEIVKDSY